MYCLEMINTDEFILVASDGLWSCMTSEEAVGFIRDHLYVKKRSAGDAAELLLEHCLHTLQSKDNISLVLVTF